MPIVDSIMMASATRETKVSGENHLMETTVEIIGDVVEAVDEQSMCDGVVADSGASDGGIQ